MKVSVITVCFNSATHIADALASVDAQDWPNLEHIVVDGASKDTTLEVLAAHSQTWRRVLSEPDGGIYDAMNKGIRLSKGDVVGFINSDDFYPSAGVLRRVADAFAVDPALQACWGDLCYVRRDEPSRVVRYWRSSPFSAGSFARGWCPPHPTFFVRRQVLERLGGFDLSYPIAADMELMARLIEVNGIRGRYLPQVLVHMRLGGTTNKSVGNIVQQNREIWRALKSLRLQPSAFSFIARKLLSRGKQFLARPAA